MCMIDYADSEGARCSSGPIWRKAKKEHKCYECFRDIARGETYRFTKGIDNDGYAFVHRVCAHCQPLVTWLMENCRGFVTKAAIEDIQEHASEYQRMDLYRLVVSARRKWRRRDGSLMKIASVPRELRP